MEKSHDYYSFICHRSQDNSFALKLQKKIERYRIPPKLGFPTRHVRHVFVDKNELRKPELKDGLIEDIRRSDSLIVLCSPTSASPVDGTAEWGDVSDWEDPGRTGWIGFEISHFMEKNPEKPYGHIIPVVIGGDPEEGNCFHPLLLPEIRQQNLKWYDFRKKKPYLDVIEAVLDPPDHAEFRKRDKLRRRKGMALAAVLTALFLTVLAFGLDFFLPRAAEYQDYILIDEVPVGIGTYTGSGDHYRITTSRAANRVRLEHLNGQGTPIPEESEAHPDGPMIAEYKLRDTGYPDTVEYLDRNGIVQFTYAYATDLAYVTFQENAFVSDQAYPVTDENEYGVANRMNIDRYELERDELGRTVSVRFMHGENYVIDDDGVAGRRYEYDEAGRLTGITYLSITGAPSVNKSGIGSIVYGYQDGYLSRKAYMDLDGTLAYGENGYAEKRITWEGKERISTYFDPDGVPIFCRQWYAKAIERFDNTGNRLSISYYGLDNEPVYCSGRYHETRWAYDSLGQMTSEAYFGTEGNPVQGRDGYARVELEYDARGNLRSRSTYGAGGQLMPTGNHAAIEERVYTRDGYLRETSFFGVNGQPVINDEAYHREVRTYDKKDRLISLRYFGIDGEGEYRQESDCYYHAAALTYDRRGNVESVSLLTTEDRLIASVNGHWAKKEMTYSGGGQVETLEYTDLLGNLIDISGNYARLVNEYDDRGLLMSTSYYNKAGNLSTDAAMVNGILAGDRFHAKVEMDYDDLGNEIVTRYYDENGGLARQRIYAIKETEYDALGRAVHYTFLDADRDPAREYHTDIFLSYDERGHLIEFRPMAGEDRSAMFTDQVFMAYGEERSFDVYGNMTGRTYLDADGGILQKKVTEYNDDCLPTAETYYDGNGARTLCPDGYWRKSTEYDERNNETHISYFGTDGKPITLAAGYSQVIQEYNGDNVMARMTFLDQDDRLVNCLAGYACVEETVTDWRCTSRAVFYDKNGRELFSYHVDYNEYGQKTQEWLAGPDGAYLDHPAYGLAMTRYIYGDNRLRVREEYYDEEGNPANLWGITSGWESKYSELGFELERTNLGAGFKPAADAKGIVTAVFEYDELGREIRRTLRDAGGKEHNCVFGFSRYQVEYGKDGEIVKTTYWNEDGEEITDLEGRVEQIVLSMNNGDYTIRETEIGTLAFTPTTFNVNRIAYCQGGDCDLMLPYSIPFNVEYDVAEIIAAALGRCAEALENDGLDLKALRVDGAEIEDLLDRYLGTLREGGNVMELFGDMNVGAVIKMLEPYASRMPTETEVMDFYEEFYGGELEDLRRQLGTEYGEGFVLSWRVTDLNESSSSIQAYNQALDRYGLELSLEDMVTLEVEYRVEGNGKSDVLNEGFLYPRVTLLKHDGSWSLGTAEGFPRPDTKELAALFGIE